MLQNQVPNYKTNPQLRQIKTFKISFNIISNKSRPTLRNTKFSSKKSFSKYIFN